MKCLCCREDFTADRRNAHHQKFCSKPACRQASKRDSHHRWLAKPQNQDHFCGPEAVERVRLWRQNHPGYWRKHKRKSAGTLQDVCLNQSADVQSVVEAHPQEIFSRTLQDVCLAQTPLLVGLLSQLIDSALQDDIVGFARRMVAKGQDLLDIPSGRSLNQKLPYDTKKTPPPGSAAASAAALQLGRSPTHSSPSAS
jgi:hypothetical protein